MCVTHQEKVKKLSKTMGVLFSGKWIEEEFCVVWMETLKAIKKHLTFDIFQISKIDVSILIDIRSAGKGCPIFNILDFSCDGHLMTRIRPNGYRFPIFHVNFIHNRSLS